MITNTEIIALKQKLITDSEIKSKHNRSKHKRDPTKCSQVLNRKKKIEKMFRVQKKGALN